MRNAWRRRTDTHPGRTHSGGALWADSSNPLGEVLKRDERPCPFALLHDALGGFWPHTTYGLQFGQGGDIDVDYRGRQCPALIGGTKCRAQSEASCQRHTTGYTPL